MKNKNDYQGKYKPKPEANRKHKNRRQKNLEREIMMSYATLRNFFRLQ